MSRRTPVATAAPHRSPGSSPRADACSSPWSLVPELRIRRGRSAEGLDLSQDGAALRVTRRAPENLLEVADRLLAMADPLRGHGHLKIDVENCELGVRQNNQFSGGDSLVELHRLGNVAAFLEGPPQVECRLLLLRRFLEREPVPLRRLAVIAAAERRRADMDQAVGRGLAGLVIALDSLADRLTRGLFVSHGLLYRADPDRRQGRDPRLALRDRREPPERVPGLPRVEIALRQRQ